MSPKAEGKLARALAAARQGLDAARIPWMCIGGIAVIARGVRRTTTDIDVAVRGEGVDLDVLVRRLARHGIRPRTADAIAFARRTQVLLLEHTTTGVELDLSLAWLSFEHEALAASSLIDFSGVRAPAALPEDLIIYKVFAGRPQDLNDAQALLLMHAPSVDLERVRKVLRQLEEIAEDRGIVERLDAIGARQLRPRAKKVTARRRIK